MDTSTACLLHDRSFLLALTSELKRGKLISAYPCFEGVVALTRKKLGLEAAALMLGVDIRLVD